MIKLNMSHNIKDVIREVEGLRKDVMDRAAMSAVNKVAAQAKTAMSREIRSEFVLTASKVRDALVVKRARIVRGVAYIEAALESPSQRGRSLNLINFTAKQTAQGVSFKIKRQGGRKTIKGAFIANKGRTVFQRVGKSRLPIEAKQTIDVAQMFNTKRINSKVVKGIEENFPRIFANEARFFTAKFNAKKASA